MGRKLKGNIILLIAAIVWGISFVAQSVGMDYIGPNTFNGIRTVLGGIVLLPVILFRTKLHPDKAEKGDLKTLLMGGLVCGFILCAASTIQTIGIKVGATAAKSGFITAMYIIFVPFIGIIFGKKLRAVTIAGAIIAVFGMYLLCMTGSRFDMSAGELYTLLCAFFFSFHILAVDYFSARVDGVKLACLQFFVSGITNLILMAIFENPDPELIKSCWTSILYSGAMSCGIGYTFQIIGQKYTDPTPAAIIMSLESVFAGIAGFILLNEAMGWIQVLGCVIMFAAIVIVQLPEKN